MATMRAHRTGESPPAKRRALPVVVELPLLPVAAVGHAPVVNANVAEAFYIPSESMEPQLQEGDRVIVSRTRRTSSTTPRRGDIVVFPSPAAAPEEEGLGDRAARTTRSRPRPRGTRATTR